jgi:hypothetical protein
VFLQRSPFEVNRCPLEAQDRPPGCPKNGCMEDLLPAPDPYAAEERS